jgi:hypothetical protein
MKYVIVGRHENVVLFSEVLTHAEVARRIGPVVSAGFYTKGSAYGRSESLGIESRPQDTEIIESFLNFSNTQIY